MVGQVEFNDTSKTVDLSAVQADAKSTYMAEGTSFVGFAGEVCALEGDRVICGYIFSIPFPLIYIKTAIVTECSRKTERFQKRKNAFILDSEEYEIFCHPSTVLLLKVFARGSTA